MRHMESVPDIDATPRRALWSDIGDFDNLDERVSAVCVLFGSVVGVNNGYVEWCPDDNPPTEQERLAWVWLCWPNLGAQLSSKASGDLLQLINAYRSGAMQNWWQSPHG
jgi:hypothetical protein